MYDTNTLHITAAEATIEGLTKQASDALQSPELYLGEGRRTSKSVNLATLRLHNTAKVNGNLFSDRGGETMVTVGRETQTRHWDVNMTGDVLVPHA